ncbi:MAG: ATP-binding protein [Oscillospiraceae bacterium]|jgi:AAA+ superfamily predicted ATPase|nr:ATP-binding protein [Oscillospiraceae bacterium]
MAQPISALASLYFPSTDSNCGQLENASKFADMLYAALLVQRKNNGDDNCLLAPPDEPEIKTRSVRAFTEIWRELISPTVFPQIKMSAFMRFCSLIAATVDIDSRYEQIIHTFLNDKTAHRPTLGLAAELFSLIEPIEKQDVFAAVYESAFELLFGKLECKSESSALSKPLVLNPTAVLAFSGGTSGGAELPDYCTAYIGSERTEMMIAHKAYCSQVSALLTANCAYEMKSSLIIRLYGKDGVGKGFTVRKAADELNKNLLFIDSEILFKSPYDVSELKQITAWCLLNNAFLCLDKFDPNTEKNAVIKETLKTLSAHLSVLVLCGTSDGVFDLPDKCICHTIEVKAADINGQMQFWKYFAEIGGYKFSKDVSIKNLVMSYDLTAGVIEDVLKLAQTEAIANSQTQITLRNIENAVRWKTRTNLSDLAVAVRAHFTWDDLILGNEAVRMLKKVCTRVRYERKVNNEWGIGAKLPYGGGAALLMYGPPGTGKTMAAQVLANELGRDLYKIELSRIVSKYIGETEKNLARIFDSAKGCNAILFFDEADALFSKRSEVKDSRDKYANTETSYLLQRLEEHDGISILATNSVPNMDIAFKRRINYFVHIEKPDEKTRLRIWQSLITAQIPICPRLNLETFANRFEMTGSEIKSALIEAAYTAAEKNSNITNELLISAIKDEYQKNGKVLSQSDIIFF